MDEYIDKEKLLLYIHKEYCEKCKLPFTIDCRACCVDDIRLEIADAPAADVVEVVHGEWVGDTNMRLNLPTLTVYDDWRCSVCGHYYPERHISRLSNYCPNCGAKMDGKDWKI